MKCLKTLEELEGKTIKKAVESRIDEAVILSFTDNSYARLESMSMYEGLYEIRFTEISGNSDKLAAGLITQEQLDNIENVRRENLRLQIEANERAQLAELKAKYEVIKNES